ncbi:TetR/AcrR family transcriptional regulator [Arthrobacter sp. 35W]|uniref:TetR/AcrR family transcriptional regulator n=1 Tax=Arthrobacter sp. 35W TaxID=1132441 RepID=UPI00041296FA|nr:TetR/AcrR family transcriptional regulator [Arthrobacter sp. 35W]
MTPGKGELRRAELLEAAEGVLVTAGNANATMRNVAEAANVRLGHLQHYFPTRSDLMQAVLERVLQRSLAQLRNTVGIDLDDGGDAPISREDTWHITSALLAEQRDPSTIRLYVEIWAMAAADEEIATVLRGFYADYAGYVERIIHRTQPLLDPGARAARATAVIALLEGAAVVRASFAGLDAAGTEDALQEATQDLIHGG